MVPEKAMLLYNDQKIQQNDNHKYLLSLAYNYSKEQP